MIFGARISPRLLSTGFHFLVDVCAVLTGFLIGFLLRFNQDYRMYGKLLNYAPSLVLAAVALACVIYIGGLYAEPGRLSKWHQVKWVIYGALICLLVVFTLGALDSRLRIGRGVLLLGYPISIALCFLHHVVQHSRSKLQRTNAICLVSGPDDEKAASILARHSQRLHIAGLVSLNGYKVSGELPLLSEISNLKDAQMQNSSVILVREKHMSMPEVATFLRRWRYEGVDVLALADLCEELFQAVPLEMVTENWLFRASTQSNLFYIKKLKRLFDVVFSLAFMVLLSPFMLIGMFLVKKQSPGSIFYRQDRLGRSGKPFTVYKLRTMHLNAESDGPKWAVDNDPRIFPAGVWLRRFRIDEIPQLWNVLKGEMSFVGPRPERDVFVQELQEQIPHYRERLFALPGLTGWAQVKYPYGSSTEDAWRKLEFDLYYMKHMSVLLDFFILLETVKIVLIGGVKTLSEHAALKNKEWQELSPSMVREKLPRLDTLAGTSLPELAPNPAS